VFRAPLEHLSSIEEGSLPKPILEGTRRVVEVYYRGRFAGYPPTAAEVRKLDQALEALAAGKGR
jgi:hypothetical protein